jgi:peptidoglycan/LPS O-acetylase OafA/YrhL
MSTFLVAAQKTETASQPTAFRHIPTLDGWRGVAILLVMADHLQTGLGHVYLHCGRHGVGIFFVLSGFLITSKLRDEFQQTGDLNLKRFYTRRFFRLMPAAWLYLLTMYLLARHSFVALQRPALLGCLLFFRNFVKVDFPSFLTGHFWSLSVEEQFYLFWPAMLLLLGLRRAPYLALAAAFAVAFWRFHNWESVMSETVFAPLGTQYRADALFIGCAAAFFIPFLSTVARRWLIYPLLLLLGFYVWHFTRVVPLSEAVLIAVLLYFTSFFSDSPASRILESKPLAFLGAISYSLYLWQEPFLYTPIYDNKASTAVVRSAWLLLVATLCHYLVDQPMIQWGRRIVNTTALPAA